MEIVTDLNSFEPKRFPNLVVALGNFDGVHLGHQEILKIIRTQAREIKGSSAVFTFTEHPQRVLHKSENPAILTARLHKLLLLDRAGIDVCFLVDFTIDLSQKSPEEFVRGIFLEKLGARQICLGFNARFGHARSGDSRLMKELAERHNFRFFEAPAFKIQEQVVSSSSIRTLVKEGKLEEAGKFLGRLYSFFGTVVSGSAKGKGLGFPTANLDPQSEVMPPEGVYAVWVRVLELNLKQTGHGTSKLDSRVVGDHFKAVLNYGKRPTLNKSEKPVPEVHIMRFKGDLTGKTLEVVVGKKLRPEKQFSGPQELRRQIQADIDAAEKWLDGLRK